MGGGRGARCETVAKQTLTWAHEKFPRKFIVRHTFHSLSLFLFSFLVCVPRSFCCSLFCVIETEKCLCICVCLFLPWDQCCAFRLLVDKWEPIDSFNKHIFLFTYTPQHSTAQHSVYTISAVNGKCGKKSHKKGYIGYRFMPKRQKIPTNLSISPHSTFVCTNPLYLPLIFTSERSIITKEEKKTAKNKQTYT